MLARCLTSFVTSPGHRYLLERSGQKDFDANKLSASELLSILLQLDSKIPELLYRLSDIDGMDTLLQAIAVYRKKEVIRADEQVRLKGFPAGC